MMRDERADARRQRADLLATGAAPASMPRVPDHLQRARLHFMLSARLSLRVFRAAVHLGRRRRADREETGTTRS